MRILVTGSTGLLGRHVVARAIADGHRVATLTRTADPEQAEMGAEPHEGSVLDPVAVAAAASGCEAVIHLAGRVSRSRRPEDAKALRRLHVEGTRVVLDVAGDAGLRRVVYASTSGTIAVSRDRRALPDETASAPDPLVRRWPYYASKLEAERLALERGRALGLELICLNPSLLLGPGDARGSSTEDVVRVATRKVPAIPVGGINLVDARDVADVAVAALEEGRPGERYLLGAANWSLRTFVHRVAELAGVPPPRLRAPDRTTLLLSRILEPVLRRVAPDSPLMPLSVELSRHWWFLDASKAMDELGFTPRPPDETLRDTLDDLRARGRIP